MSADLYTDGLVALHNMGVTLDHARHTPRGAPEFPVQVDPLAYVVERLWRLMGELSWRAPADQDCEHASLQQWEARREGKP